MVSLGTLPRHTDILGAPYCVSIANWLFIEVARYHCNHFPFPFIVLIKLIRYLRHSLGTLFSLVSDLFSLAVIKFTYSLKSAMK